LRAVGPVHPRDRSCRCRPLLYLGGLVDLQDETSHDRYFVGAPLAAPLPGSRARERGPRARRSPIAPATTALLTTGANAVHPQSTAHVEPPRSTAPRPPTTAH